MYKIDGPIRKSNFELLRFVSMLMIVLHHYILHGSFNILSKPLNTNKVIAIFLLQGGKIGVNIFVILSGYFLIKSKFNFKKLLKLFLQTTFFSLVFSFLIQIFYYRKINYFTIINDSLSFFNYDYWFVTAYSILFILIDYINDFINSLTKERHLRLILILTFIFSISTTFFNFYPNFDDISWFFVLYLIGSYIKINKPDFLNKKICLSIGFISYLFLILLSIFFELLGKINPIFWNYIFYFSDRMQKTTTLFIAIFLFAGFKNLKIKNNNFINFIGSSTFSVYLLHENKYLRNFFWEKLFKNKFFYNQNFFILHPLVSTIIIFLLGTLLNFFYKKTIEKKLLAILCKIIKLKD